MKTMLLTTTVSRLSFLASETVALAATKNWTGGGAATGVMVRIGKWGRPGPR